MKKIFLIVLLILVVLSLSYSYDFAQAGVSFAGGALGSYAGQLAAVPLLILSSNLGIVKEDIFSPFSSALYNAMETGGIIGTITGSLTAKYVYRYILYQNINWSGFGIDFLVTSVIVIVPHLIINWLNEDLGIPPFIRNVIVIPALAGVYLGFEIPGLS